MIYRLFVITEKKTISKFELLAQNGGFIWNTFYFKGSGIFDTDSSF